MRSELTITKKHDSYVKDAVILALIGFAAGAIYFLIRVFIPWEPLVYIYIFSVASSIWVIKQKFLPETYVFKKDGNDFTIWRRGEFVDKQPDEKEFIDLELTEDSLKVNYKNFGMSKIKSSTVFSKDDFGKDALEAITQFIGNNDQFDPAVLKSSADSAAKVSGGKFGNTVFARVTYKPSPVPVTFASYVLLTVTVVCINYYLSLL